MDRYRLILADPPWTYNDQGTRLSPSYEGKQKKSEKEYDTMSFDDICSLGAGIKGITEDDALLLLWCPGPLMETHPWPVIRAWGFHFSTCVPWVKVRWDAKQGRYVYNIGGGHSVRSCAENLLVCSRGKLSSIVKDRGVPGAILAPTPRGRRGVRHSAKPDQQYELAERLVEGPYCELFSRQERDGWMAIGDEISGEDIRQVLGVVPCSAPSASTVESMKPCLHSTQTTTSIE
jgi:N6-adenosine-specific RNA methylase IME4